MKYNIAVTTEVWKDNELWWDGGTMRWFNVDEEVRGWLAGSCKTTAFWLLGMPEVVSGERYSIRYRTVVTSDGAVISDTTMVEFDNMSYDAIIKFQYWALKELDEMVKLFATKHEGNSFVKKREWLKQLWRLVRHK